MPRCGNARALFPRQGVAPAGADKAAFRCARIRGYRIEERWVYASFFITRYVRGTRKETGMKNIQRGIVDGCAHVQHAQHGMEHIVVRKRLPGSCVQTFGIDVKALPE